MTSMLNIGSYHNRHLNMSSHGLWVERYRPQDLSTYVGNEHLKSKVERFLDDGNIPHLLLYGRAGGGKTTHLLKLLLITLSVIICILMLQMRGILISSETN